MLKDDTKVLALALPNFCVGHSAAVLTGLEHNHKRWLPVARAFVLPTSCNDRFRSCALAWSTTFDGGCGSMFALKLDVRACTRLVVQSFASPEKEKYFLFIYEVITWGKRKKSSAIQ